MARRYTRKNPIKVNAFSSELQKLLKEYGDECTDTVNSVMPKLGKETAANVKKDVRSKFKKGSGGSNYANGWTYKVVYGRLNTGFVVYNKNKPTLTHLLENGHAIANGTGRVAGRPHIAPSYEWAQEEAVKRIKEELKK